MPAEWEPHAATWLAFPHEISDWPGKFGPVPWVFAEIARALAPGERVRLIVNDAKLEKVARQTFERAGVPLTEVDFIRSETNRSWTRDFVPSFVVRGKRPRRAGSLGGRQRDGIAAVKWRFNGWARYKNHAADEQTGQRVARWLDVPCFEPRSHVGRREDRIVLEGGAIDVDGEGTLLTPEECLLDGRQARNPRLGAHGHEQILLENLGIERVIWLERGIAGDDTGGHVDDFARFVAPGVVVLAQEKNKRDPNHRILEAARERLEGARDARGRRLRVLRVPMPAPLLFDGQRLPASYANFYVGNAAVLVPTFNDPLDRTALGILSEAFPGRRVVGIHALDLVLGLGTIHCSTQQEPL
ncbi:MAG TPA: agmatine deiminase family protein [Polyangiaceae bacterium]|nr:agmatine deiminase family protein [Polyangiaceae bacterium]